MRNNTIGPSQIIKVCTSPVAQTPLISQRVIWIGFFSSLVGTLIMGLWGDVQLARLFAFIAYFPGNLIWLQFATNIRSLQLTLLNLTFLATSIIGIANNLTFP